MSYSNASKVYFETLRAALEDDITDAFTPVGTPYANPARILDLFNDTDQALYISFDGVNPHIYIPSHSGRIYNYATNRQAASQEFNQSKETQIYVSFVTAEPTVGGLYVTIIYGSTQ